MPYMLGSTGRTGRVSEAIARRIKKQISEGRLSVGEKLPAERDMARQYKTSRVSVREAYRSLEEVGLLRIRRGAEGGAFVAQFDHEPVRRSLSLVLGLGKATHEEVTEARMLLEPSIARLAALRARPEDVGKLELVLIQEEQEVRHATVDSGSTAGQFHRALGDCAHNMPLVVVINALADLTAETVSTLDVRIRSRHRRKNCEYHRRIFEAIRAHDGDAAYALMLKHVGDIQSRVSRSMKTAAHNGMCGPAAAPRRHAGRRQ
jgi:GntR family transcriptional regulator, transcriptional repressor for pyruvate dehydrogenase complex